MAYKFENYEEFEASVKNIVNRQIEEAKMTNETFDLKVGSAVAKIFAHDYSDYYTGLRFFGQPETIIDKAQTVQANIKKLYGLSPFTSFEQAFNDLQEKAEECGYKLVKIQGKK